jgi:hypothetical protein
MILCPNCAHKEMVGVVFCSECGAQLIFADGAPTLNIRPTTAGFSAPRAAPASAVQTPVEEEAARSAAAADIAINIISAGKVLPLAGAEETTLGRVSEGQPIVPDIDLTPYRAYEAGVSRMHASLSVTEDGVMVTDLGSANGTRVNGRQITSHIPYPVKHGDILTLGKFKIQVLLRNP